MLLPLMFSKRCTLQLPPYVILSVLLLSISYAHAASSVICCYRPQNHILSWVRDTKLNAKKVRNIPHLLPISWPFIILNTSISSSSMSSLNFLFFWYNSFSACLLSFANFTSFSTNSFCTCKNISWMVKQFVLLRKWSNTLSTSGNSSPLSSNLFFLFFIIVIWIIDRIQRIQTIIHDWRSIRW